jgi:hypothetical protein
MNPDDPNVDSAGPDIEEQDNAETGRTAELEMDPDGLGRSVSG